MIADPTLYTIEHGDVEAFADWRIKRPDIPRVAAGGYTIWEDDRPIYSGMAGASLTADDIARQKTAADITREGKGQRPSRQYCGLGDPYTFSSSNVYQFIAETRLALATPRPTAST
ncbi:MAG: hypothetical protein QOE12_722 [Mycobacterium sp.]|nr:hypothetical protein [Mycobacterium sp.]